MTADSTNKRMASELAATFLRSIAMLGIQIGWTRIFSFMIWYHFAFLVISTAMLGFTVGGLLINLRPGLLQRGRSGVLLPSAFAFAITTALSLLVVCNLPFSGGVLDSFGNFALFLVLVLLLAASFLSAGLFVAAMVVQRARGVARVYAANMVGSVLVFALIACAQQRQRGSGGAACARGSAVRWSGWWSRWGFGARSTRSLSHSR